MLMSNFYTMKYDDGVLTVLDQTLLPTNEVYIELKSVQDVYDAIKRLSVRGAPAIGVCAAYGLAISARSRINGDIGIMLSGIKQDAAYLSSSRPTAVNLKYALDRVLDVLCSMSGSYTPSDIIAAIEVEADRMRCEDANTNRNIGENLLSLLHDGDTVLTHCNAGILATTAYGTALSPFYLAKEKGIDLHVYADETRPLLQGARLTAWELCEAGVDVTLICDNMAASVMSTGNINAVIVGCDRVAANGDTANKIGTYGVAVLAKHFGIPVYIATPTTTIDMNCPTGIDIPIEQRDGSEVRTLYGVNTAPSCVKVLNPAFDVTPNELIAAIVTEHGILRPPYSQSLANLFNNPTHE